MNWWNNASLNMTCLFPERGKKKILEMYVMVIISFNLVLFAVLPQYLLKQKFL